DNSCLDRCQWENDHSSLHWHDLVANRVRQTATQLREELSPLTMEQRKQGYRQLVRDILAMSDNPEEQVRLWGEKTGKSQSRFYHYKVQVQSREFDNEIA